VISPREHLAGADDIIGATLAQQRGDFGHDGSDPDGKPVATVVVAAFGGGVSPHGWFVTHVGDS
jgi:hypothetical protein